MAARSFRYTALDASGVRQEGQIEARDRSRAIDLLKARRLVITELQEGAVPGASDWRTRWNRIARRRLSWRDLALFTRELAALMAAGLPVTRAIEALLEDQENSSLFRGLISIKHAVEGGQSLSNALRQQAHLFPAFYANLVEAGEQSGELVRVLDRLAAYIEWVESMRRRAVGALMYPVLVVVFSGFLALGLVLFLLPRFAQTYQTLGAELPLPTAVLLQSSAWLGHHGWWLLVLGGAMVFAARGFLRTEKTRLAISRAVLQVPWVGPLVARFAITRFARTLAMLYQGGIPILLALDISARTCGNVVYQRALVPCREAVSSGGTLAAALRATDLFPSVMINMIDVGERSGGLVDMLNRAADFHEGEMHDRVQALSTVLEPLLIVWVGLLIGSLLMVLFLPIMNLNQIL